ncbi:MAG: ABC transporter ATP-binding protein [Sphaerochaetaceae bacterium]|jgi:ABC-2 type transport system ATP-binding protein|nr:ABC transporter ATP-binding protein [Sphaerochaetaceae bacterium]MDD3942046.1 ABC transporter ATP-binding protein [Sphaerochaetaceae bacterium]MDX9940243.1 ABC transporter ATP-binding protein [Sphaerochaetaceae bacterium]
MVRIEQVSKRYGNAPRPAVEQLDLEVKRGEIFGFLGPNGAGKSTTIKMMVGLLRPDTGSIAIDGFDSVKDPMATKMAIGYVPDEPLLYERMSAREYVFFICEMFKVSRKDASVRLDSLARKFSLLEVLDDRINTFSRGMKQKLGIIAALVHEPQLLVLDEPMVGLDPRASFVLKEVMRDFCKSGRSVFFSTHVMEVAERLCDRVGIIGKGRLIACDTFHNLQQRLGNGDGTLEQLFLELTDEHA